jgi:thiosulfate reductase/polysulfide reductase chain A
MLTRRSLLRLAGAAGGSLLAGSRLRGAFDDVFQAATPAAGAQVLTSSCGICDSACGLRATLQDGVLRFLEGLPGDNDGGGGGLCAKGGAGAGLLYDPDRLKYPMKRTNPAKGFDVDPGWVRISWTEALDTVATQFGNAIAQHGAESALVVSRPSPDIWTRFLNSIGIVNRVDHLDECYMVSRIVQRYMTGPMAWAHDFVNSKYIVLFGWDLLAKGKLVFARGIVDAKANGAKVVCFNPQYSATGRFADEWFPIRPGTDLAVALAMINVLVSENLYDQDFVTNYTNFAANETQIRSHFAQYTPEWAEQQSEVPADAIRRIAREFGQTRPAVVPAHKKTMCANHTNGSQLVQAINVLNILAGTIDRPGGRYAARTLAIPTVDAVYPPPAYPPKQGRRVDGKDKLPLVLEDGGGMFSTLADGMLNKFPGMIQAAFFNQYTMLGFPNPLRITEALKSVPFIAVYDFLPNDVTAMADIVLPGTIYLEANDLVTRDMSSKYPIVLARQAVVPAMFESKSIAYVAVELGKRLAPNYFKTSDGSWINPSVLLDEKTKRAGIATNFAEFAQKGVYSQPAEFVPSTTFKTPSGKCQVFVPEFAAKGYDALPVWKEKRDLPSSEYPYFYLTYIPAFQRRNTTENNAILTEMLPVNVANMSTGLAKKLGVAEGQTVRLRSRVGAIELPAHLVETLRPDVVMVAHGYGQRSKLMKVAGGRGVRDGDVIPDQSIDEVVAAGNFAGASGIMDAVVAIEPR